ASRIAEAKLLSPAEQPLDLAIIDLNLPDGNGLDLMSELKAIHPRCQYIVLTGFGTVETAVRATQSGAFHFLTKPFNVEELLSVAEKAVLQRQLQQENQQLRSELFGKYKFD